MPMSQPVNWQPLSQMPLIASMIDGALNDTRDHLQTLAKGRARPHVLDDATIDPIASYDFTWLWRELKLEQLRN